jgi:hypothetical protein
MFRVLTRNGLNSHFECIVRIGTAPIEYNTERS